MNTINVQLAGVVVRVRVGSAPRRAPSLGRSRRAGAAQKVPLPTNIASDPSTVCYMECTMLCKTTNS